MCNPQYIFSVHSSSLQVGQTAGLGSEQFLDVLGIHFIAQGHLSGTSSHSTLNPCAVLLKYVFPRHCDNLIRKYWIHLFRSCSASVYPVKRR